MEASPSLLKLIKAFDYDYMMNIYILLEGLDQLKLSAAPFLNYVYHEF